MKLNAPRLHAHWTSLLWANQLAMTTMKSVQEMLEDFGVSMGLSDPRDEDHVDIRIEALMPKVCFSLLRIVFALEQFEFMARLITDYVAHT